MSTPWVAKQALSQSFCIPESKFKVEDIPDLSGRVIIVTGGNTGIGKETVKALLNKNAKVYMASRNQARAQAAIDDLKEITGKEAIFLELDLSNLKKTKAAAEAFKNKENRLHILFNNAGVMMPDVNDVTDDGYDLQFGSNVLGHFLFTKELLPVLIKTANSSQPGSVRVVNTSSSAQLFAKKINYGTLRASDLVARKKMGTTDLYAQSKFGNVLFANELARRYGDQGVVSTSLNPGNIKSDLQRHLTGVKAAVINKVVYDTPFGALTQLWAGTSPEGKDFNGKYLIPWARLGESRPETRDQAVGEELWNWLEEQVKNV